MAESDGYKDWRSLTPDQRQQVLICTRMNIKYSQVYTYQFDGDKYKGRKYNYSTDGVSGYFGATTTFVACIIIMLVSVMGDFGVPGFVVTCLAALVALVMSLILQKMHTQIKSQEWRR